MTEIVHHPRQPLTCTEIVHHPRQPLTCTEIVHHPRQPLTCNIMWVIRNHILAFLKNIVNTNYFKLLKIVNTADEIYMYYHIW
jgi:hypothetical protein